MPISPQEESPNVYHFDPSPRHESPRRRLSAVLAIDVAGYTALMERDEAGTHEAVIGARAQVVEPLVAAHHGHIIKFTGDGFLVVFPSVLETAAAAIGMQRLMAELNAQRSSDRQLNFRMGINVGDVIVEADDIYGEIVNLAARLEAIAEPGGICIAGSVYEQIRYRVDLPFVDLGWKSLKNIDRQVQVYGLSACTLSTPQVTETKLSSIRAAIGMKDRPRNSVAVLPFSSLSPHGEDDYFADGMIDDITTALSHFKGLFVIARTSSFIYKGRRVDARQIGGELGVNYLVEGSVRRAGGRLRIVVQLVDALSGAHLWADKFDGELVDVFELQDRISQQVATTIEPRILSAEFDSTKKKSIENLDAYDYYLRATPYREAWTSEATDIAISLLEKAIELDPNYAPALAAAASCYSGKLDQGWGSGKSEIINKALHFARAAIEAGRHDARALCLGGHTIASMLGEWGTGATLIGRALKLNPNYADAWTRSGMVHVYLNDLDTAIDHSERGIELNPFDPRMFLPLSAKGYAYLFQCQYGEAAEMARGALLSLQKPEMAHRILITALAALGRKEEMYAAAKNLTRQIPAFRISAWRCRTKFNRDSRFDEMEVALRTAGLPE